MKAINDFGITIPEEAIFTHEGAGRYQWKVDKLARGDTLIDGTITCTYYSDTDDINLILDATMRGATAGNFFPAQMFGGYNGHTEIDYRTDGTS